MTDYTKLRELAQAATDGPWVIEWAGDIEHDEDRGLPVAILHPIDVARQVYIVDDENGNALNVSNAEFIAAANPTVVLALLDELRDAAEDFGTPNDVEIFPVEFDWPADARRTREHLRRRADELDPPRPLPTVRRPV